MDLLILASGFVLIAVIGAIIYFLKFHNSQGGEVANVAARGNVVANVPRGVLVPAGPVRRRVPRAGRNRRANQESDSEGSDEEMFDSGSVQGDEKMGAKKMRKLEEKAAKKAQREAELEEREEKKKQNEKLDKLRKAEEKRKEAEEAHQLLEEQKVKEEQARQEHEAYLMLRKDFQVEEEGEDAEEEDESQTLQQFIAYIKEKKVIMLEDLAAHFKLKTQDVIDRIKTLQADGSLSGVIDDRGKFVYITTQEYEAVARFIKQRGRVSITELAENMNRLIDLNPEHAKLNAEGNVENQAASISISC